jgi:ComEC/Rec2-related protein
MFIAYGFIGGVVLGVFYPISPDTLTWFWVISGGIGLGGLGFAIFQYEQLGYADLLIYFLVFAVAFAGGWGRYSLTMSGFYEDHIREFLVGNFDKERVVEAEVVASPNVYRDKVRIRITPTKIWMSPKKKQSVKVSGGDLYIQVRKRYYDDYYQNDLGLDYGPSYDQLSKNSIYGDKIEVTGAILEPTGQTNPFGFNYKQFLFNQGIYGAVWFPKKIEILERGIGNPIVNESLALQEEMLRTIKMTMPFPQSAFLGGVTLGLRNGLEYTVTPFEDPGRKITYEFRSAGTIHVLAVSGLHVTVIAGTLWALFAGLRIPSKLYAPIIIVCLLVFTIITGARPATMRAAIMAGLIVAVFAYSGESLKNSVLVGLALAAVFILLYNPRLVFEASFTLSFTAVLCLALITGPVDRVLQKLRGMSFIVFWIWAGLTTYLCIYHWNTILTWYIVIPYATFWAIAFWYSSKIDQRKVIAGGIGFLDIPSGVRNFIAAQFAIQLGMMYPLSAYYFGEFPYAGMYANLLAIPLVGIVVPLGLFAGLVGLIPTVGPYIALVLNAGNYLAVQLFLWISHVASEIFPYPAVRKLNVFHLFLIYVALAIFVWWRPFYDKFKSVWFWACDNLFQKTILRPRKAVATVLGGTALLLFLASFTVDKSPDQLRVTVLDVGYGSAIAVQTPKGRNVLINGAARVWDWHHPQGLADRRDNGRQTVSPFFLNQRIKHLDSVIAQSPEPQRIGGLAYILRQFVVDRFFGSLDGRTLTPFSRENYLAALNDPYYSSQSTAQWFKKDYYGNWERLWSVVQNKGIPYNPLGENPGAPPRRGRVIFQEQYGSGDRAKELSLSVISPPRDHQFREYRSNNRSLVLRLEYGEISFLFPGDIRTEGQMVMLPRSLRDQSLGPPGLEDRFLKHDVMLAPSNGMQKSSYNRSFIEGVEPEYVVMSTGEPTIKGGLASDLTSNRSANVKKYKQDPTVDTLLRTDQDNAIMFSTDGDTLAYRTWGESDQETGGEGSFMEQRF